MRQSLPQIRQTLKETLPLGIDITFQKLKRYLPQEAVKYNEVILLESRYQTAHRNLLRDTEDSDDIRREFNRIREALLALINGLEEKDFEKVSANQPKPKPKRGNILYRIPNAMEVEKEAKCLVRIAFTKEILMEALKQEEEDVIQSIRISEVMGVEIIDPNENAPFKIRTFSETVQLIYKEDFTEWVFYVKPLHVGEFSLLLKVSVVEMREGKERKRNIVLEEKVVITSETVDTPEPGFKSANYSLVTAAGMPAKTVSNPAAPSQPQKRSLFRRFAAMLASILLLITITFALYQYWKTNPWFQGLPENPPQQNSVEIDTTNLTDAQKELLEWREALEDSSKIETLDYLSKFPSGEFAQNAHKRLEKLDWNAAKQDTTGIAIRHYIETYGIDGEYIELALQRAKLMDIPSLNKLIENPPLDSLVLQLDSMYQKKADEASLIDSTNNEMKPSIKDKDETTTETSSETPSDTSSLNDRRVENNSNKDKDSESVKNKENALNKKSKPDDNEVSKIDKSISPQKDTPSEEQTVNDDTDQENKKNKDTADQSTEDNKNNPSNAPAKEKKILNTILNNMVFVAGGSYSMGCTTEQKEDCKAPEQPVLSRQVASFYISKYEVTFAEYDAFCEATGRTKPDDIGWGRAQRPVINVSWFDAVAYCKWLSKKTKRTFRLPSETEWEFAARGGNQSRKSKFSGASNPDAVAWYNNNSSTRTQPVGTKQANELGLYDMSGNVEEWCRDEYGDYHSKRPVVPKISKSSKSRVLRGGSCTSYENACRVSNRSGLGPGRKERYYGFRVVMVE